MLLRDGVARADIFLDHAGFRTLDTMHRAAAVFEVRDAIICTQRFHLARSVYLARHFGIDAVGGVADRQIYRAAIYNELREALARANAVLDAWFGRGARLGLTATPERADGRDAALTELIGPIVYRKEIGDLAGDFLPRSASATHGRSPQTCAGAPHARPFASP